MGALNGTVGRWNARQPLTGNLSEQDARLATF
jgi:hypothetical protein